MATIRWQLRGLFLALMATGILWVDLMNYVHLGAAWEGSLRNPVTAVVTGAAVFSVLFHISDLRGAFLPALADPVTRTELLNTILRHMVVSLFLAILLFTFSQRFLQRGVAAFALREVPDRRRVPLGTRIALLVFGLAITYTSIFTTSPPGVPPGRMLLLYLPLAALTGVVGYLVAADTGRDLIAIADRLRVLAGGLRPDLFHRLPVTGQDEVTELLAVINSLQDRVEGEFRAIERDLQSARTIQTELLPHSWQAPPGWDIAAGLLPAQAVDGDFYDLIPLADGRLGIVVGDAAGKGLPAAPAGRPPAGDRGGRGLPQRHCPRQRLAGRAAGAPAGGAGAGAAAGSISPQLQRRRTD